MMSIFKQICFITTSYFLSFVPLWLFYTQLWKHCYVNWSKSGLSDPHTRGPVEWTYEREIKQTVRSLRVIVCLQVCFLYWWGVSCPILSDCVQEACVSCCVMVDQFQDQRKTQELQICSYIFSNWLYRSVSREQLLVLDLMSTGLLLYLAPTSLFPVVSPKTKAAFSSHRNSLLSSPSANTLWSKWCHSWGESQSQLLFMNSVCSPVDFVVASLCEAAPAVI